MVIINLIFLVGIIFLWWRKYGVVAAAAGLVGMIVVISLGDKLPWWIVIPMIFWLCHIVRRWGDPQIPEPKILDTK